MYVMKIGINYEATPINIREQLTFPEHTIDSAMIHLGNCEAIIENVILSTCNRTEIYVVAEELHKGRASVVKFLSDWFQLNTSIFTPYLEIVTGEEAIKHLFQVITGLHSMVLGETQILGQVRDTFLTALSNKTTGRIFNELFKRAITFAKRAHRETGIGAQAVSVSYAAVELANQSFASLDDQKVVVIGAGEMSELALKNLLSLGVQQVTIVNRTLSRAQSLADRYQVKATTLENLSTVLQDADIVLTSTGSTTPILSKDELKVIQRNRDKQPLFLIDIGVPRDLDPAIRNIEYITLYDIDDLQAVIDKNLAKREQAAEKIKDMLAVEIESFKDWITVLGAVPVIAALHDKGISIQEKTLASIYRKMPHLTDREKKVLHNHTRSIVNQLLREPIQQAKQMSQTNESAELLSQLVDIFGIDESVKKRTQQHIDQYETLMSTKVNQQS